MPAQYIPAYLQSRYPNIRPIVTSDGHTILSSTTPFAPWGDLRNDLESGGRRYSDPRLKYGWDPKVNTALIDPKTGLPTTGGITGRNYGSTTSNTGKQPWELIVTPKLPELNPQIDALTKTQQGASQDWQKTFKQLQEEELANLKSQVGKTNAALDTSSLSAELRGADAQYQTDARDYLSQSGQRNEDYAKETAALLERNRANTDAMVTNLDAQLAEANAAANARTKAYQAGTGTPTSGSGALSNRFIRETMPARLRYLQDVWNVRRADIALEQGAARELYGNDKAQLALRNALDNQFRGNTVETARYLYDVTARASQLQGAQLTDYLNQVIRVMGLGQQFIANDANNLSMLARLKMLANDYTYKSDYNPAGTPATPYYTPAQPRRNYFGGDGVPPTVPSGRGYGGGYDDTLQAIADANGGYGGSAAAVAAQREHDRRTLPAWLFNQRAASGMYGYAPPTAGSRARDYVYTPEGSADYYDAYGSFPTRNVTLPNDYAWGRSPEEQATFEAAQRSYE